eukprot:8265379-Pyramimonas_sp.AAC.1
MGPASRSRWAAGKRAGPRTVARSHSDDNGRRAALPGTDSARIWRVSARRAAPRIWNAETAKIWKARRW